MTPTATQQYIINQLPTNPSQITSGSVSVNFGFGATTLNYFKVGKLYFGLWILSTGTNIFLNGDATTIAHVESTLAAALGFSSYQATYAGDNYGAYTQSWSGSWNSNPPANNNRDIFLGFMTN